MNRQECNQERAEEVMHKSQMCVKRVVNKADQDHTWVVRIDKVQKRDLRSEG